MNQIPEVHREAARKRRLTVVAVGVLVLSGGILGGVFYRQNRASRVAFAAAPERPWQNPKIEKGLREARAAKALKVRADFRLWALKHKGLIQKMMRAKGDDETAATAVYNALPTFPEEAGMPGREWSTTKPPFSWVGYTHGMPSVGHPDHKPWMEKSTEAGRKRRRKDFIERRDLFISDSVNAGPNKVVLWATGRVTEEGIMPNPDPNPPSGAPAFVDAPSKQLAPSYDFLKQ